MTHHIDLDTVTLHSGRHDNPDQGHCLLEVVSMFAEEPFTDAPKCVSPVLRVFGISWNDGLRSDEERAQLKQYIPRLVGTAGDTAADERRAWMATDWLVRVHTPAWLDAAGLTDQAARLRGLPELVSGDQIPSVKPVLEAVRADAAAARDAARAAARAAAGAAARAAAGAAARAAAWAAAGDAARAAAGAAAWAAAGDAAWAAARDAAEKAQRQGRGVWGAVYDAVKPTMVDAVNGPLGPVVAELQQSAHDLYSRMIDVRAEVSS